MANLPDLDAGQISFVAYWNAIDQGGVSEINPSEVTSSANVIDYTTYDNGVEGNYQLTYWTTTAPDSDRSPQNRHRNATFRVKEDGWIIVYLDADENYTIGTTDPALVDGPWDILNDWTVDGFNGMVNNKLERGVNDLQSQLSNSGSIAYDQTSVGLYDYGNQDATTVTWLHDLIGGEGTYSPSLSYSGVTMYWASFVGIASTDDTLEAGEVYSYAPDGAGTSVLASASSSTNDYRYGTIDALSNSLIPSEGTTYTGEVKVSYTDIQRASLNLISSWG